MTAGPGRPPIRCPSCRGEGSDRHGHEHRKLRDALAGSFVPGTACTRCREPIEDVADAHLDHSDDGAGYRGWSHARCNASAGASRGNAMRAEAYRRLAGLVTSDRPRKRRGAALAAPMPDGWPGGGCPRSDSCPVLMMREQGATCGSSCARHGSRQW